jgi:transposase InsO family protein
MIIGMTTASRPQQRYDHRLRDLVRRTGDLTVATDLGVRRSTARRWLRAKPTIAVSLAAADLTEHELREEILKLGRHVEKLAALLRLALALLHASGFTLSRERLPDGHGTLRILRAVDRARACIPLRAILRFLGVSPRRFQAWLRRQAACALDDQSSCPRTSPHRLTLSEVQAIRDMVTAPEYRHVSTGTLAVLAQRLGTVCASPSTWYRLVRKYGWRRPSLRVHPAKPKVGLRTTRADEMWHIDTTVIRLLDGTRAYLHAVIDNFSRRILAWRVAQTFAPVNSVAVLLEASQGATPTETTPVVLADAGVENVNAQVDDLIATGVLRRVLAFTELKFSNSMIEAWWRSLKHQWLFLHSLDSVTTVRRLVKFYFRNKHSADAACRTQQQQRDREGLRQRSQSGVLLQLGEAALLGYVPRSCVIIVLRCPASLRRRAGPAATSPSGSVFGSGGWDRSLPVSLPSQAAP